jgi:hypothetical protein
MRNPRLSESVLLLGTASLVHHALGSPEPGGQTITKGKDAGRPIEADARGFLLVTDAARSPHDPGNGRIMVRAEARTMRFLSVRSPGKCHDVRIARTVLEDPRRIYSGIRPDEVDDWGWCYVSPYNSHFSERGKEVDLEGEWLFLAFISPRYTLLEWGLERPTEGDPLLPESANIRFGQLVWPTT